jgi:hypothetical protein
LYEEYAIGSHKYPSTSKTKFSRNSMPLPQATDSSTKGTVLIIITCTISILCNRKLQITGISCKILQKFEKNYFISSINFNPFRLKELLRTRLIECGWRDQVQMLCRDVVRERGVHNLKADDLIAEITSKGRGITVIVIPFKGTCFLHRF